MLRLRKKKKSFSAPVEVFSFFTEFFNVTKGALLIREKSGGFFSIWALAGYDYTTSNRLFISENDADKIFSSPDSNGIVYLKNSSLSILNSYFSSREYALLTSVIAVPFFSEDSKLFAFILVSDLKNLETANFAEIAGYRNLYHDIFRDHLYYFYKNIRLGRDNAVFLPAETAFRHISEINDKNHYANYYCAVFNMSSFFSFIKQEIKFTIHSAFQNNIIRLFSSFVSENGSIFILDSQRICILKDAPSLNDKEIIAYQIFHVLKSLLPFHDYEIDFPGNFIDVFHLPADNDLLKEYLDA